MNCDPTTLECLEWEKISRTLASLCLTVPVAEKWQTPTFHSDEALLEREKSRVNDLAQLLIRAETLPVLNFPDIRSFLAELVLPGLSLTGLELKALAQFLLSASRLKSWLLEHSTAFSLEGYGRELGESLEDMGKLAESVDRTLDEDGQIREDRVPSLQRIRKTMGLLNQELEKTARELLRKPDYRDYWQSENTNLKDGRVVLPLRSNFKGRVQGILHESSSSGATLFLEPPELMEKNNSLSQAHHQYHQEVLRILKDFSRQFQEQQERIKSIVRIVEVWDHYFCRARYGQLTGARLLPSDCHEIRLIQARHPLLGKKAVAISLEMAADQRLLVLSGPNTGGKTVTLKTVALLSLMNQAALPLPVAEGSCLPLWAHLGADVGDSQSLEESLSTFSGHIQRINNFLGSAGPRSLIILDELGSGTDPAEGGALALALLESLLGSEASILVTTHLSVVKNLALGNPLALNASMEYDAALAKPTYRVVPGLPGESHALDIAGEVGLPRKIIQRARELRDSSEGSAERVLRELRDRELDFRNKEAALELQQRVLMKGQRDLEDQNFALKERELEIRNQGLVELRQLLKESRRTLENLVRELREGQLDQDKIRQAREFTEKLQNEVQEWDAQNSHLENIQEQTRLRKMQTNLNPDIPLAEEWKSGDQVQVIKGGDRGEILRREGKARFLVGIGSIKMRFAPGDLKWLGPPEKAQVKVTADSPSTVTKAVFQLDLRGERLESALLRLEQQLQGAHLSGLREFSVIHGLGNGILQRGVQDYLRNCPEVREFHFARPEEGGFGKTLVYLESV